MSQVRETQLEQLASDSLGLGVIGPPEGWEAVGSSWYVGHGQEPHCTPYLCPLLCGLILMGLPAALGWDSHKTAWVPFCLCHIRVMALEQVVELFCASISSSVNSFLSQALWRQSLRWVWSTEEWSQEKGREGCKTVLAKAWSQLESTFCLVPWELWRTIAVQG